MRNPFRYPFTGRTQLQGVCHKQVVELVRIKRKWLRWSRSVFREIARNSRTFILDGGCGGHRPLLSKLAKSGGRVLLPLGEGGPAKREPDRVKPQEKGRMRAKIDALPNPHPALRASLS